MIEMTHAEGRAGRSDGHGRQRFPMKGWALLGIGFVFATSLTIEPASAQDLVIAPAATSLESLSGQNSAQGQMGVSIDGVCPTLVANKDSISGDVKDLQVQCTRMIQSANEVIGSGVTDESYGLGEGELNGALQQFNGEEINAPREHLAEVGDGQRTAVGGRMAALRSGLRGGTQVSLQGLDRLVERQYALGEGFSDTQLAADDDFSTLVPDWGVFITGSFNFGDQDATSTAEGFDFNAYGATAGVDYRFTDNLIAGIAGGFNFFDADFDTSLSSSSGQELNSHSYSISAYGTYYIGDSFYVESVVGYSFINYDSERRITVNSQTGVSSLNRTAEGDFDGQQFSASAGMGYQVSLEGIDLTPYARGAYSHADIDGYSENGAWGLDLTFGDQDVDSLTTTLGLLAAKPISTGFGVLVPTVWGEWIHEFMNNNDGSSVAYKFDPTGLSSFTAATEDPDRDYFQVGAGVVAVLPGGWSPFANYQSILGLENLSSHLFTIGVRKEL